jgi:hypothetical protein
MALLAALMQFSHLLAGFTNRQLVELVARMLAGPYTTRQATDDLRRLRRKRLIARVAGTHRYYPTGLGLQAAVLFTKAHTRVLAPGLALLNPTLPPDLVQRSPLTRAWQHLDHALDDFVDRQFRAA